MKNVTLKKIIEILKKERWLFDPKNKEIVAKLKKSIKKKATKKIDLSSFEKLILFSAPKIKTKGFKFNREEANAR